MTIYYSALTSGFYNTDAHTTIPNESVEVSEEQYKYLFHGQSEGMQIVADATGKPVLIAPVVLPLTYKELRASAYPPMYDYLDAIVKGDAAQQQAYIDACLAVKAKYPKGVVCTLDS